MVEEGSLINARNSNFAFGVTVHTSSNTTKTSSNLQSYHCAVGASSNVYLKRRTASCVFTVVLVTCSPLASVNLKHSHVAPVADQTYRNPNINPQLQPDCLLSWIIR